MMVHFVTQSTSNKVLEAQLFALLCLNSKADAEKGKSKAQGSWRNRGGGAPQILADQLTLSQPWGQIMSFRLQIAPPDF